MERLVNIGPRERVGVAAWHSLAPRLRNVRRNLRRAADRADKRMEYVHELRVATRRAHAALTIYCDLLREKDFLWWNKWLKRIRDSAAQARDSDVMASYFAADEGLPPGLLRQWILRRLAEDRAVAQHPIWELADHLNKKRWKRHRKRLKKHLLDAPAAAARELFGPWAQHRLQPLVTSFWQAAPAATASLADLHQFRIEAKKLRYAIELLGAVFPASLGTIVLPNLVQIQQTLGELNDCQGRLQRVEGWCSEIHDRDLLQQLDQLVDQQLARSNELQRSFTAWWSGQSNQLRQSLQDSLPDAEAGDDEAVPA